MDVSDVLVSEFVNEFDEAYDVLDVDYFVNQIARPFKFEIIH